MDEGQPCLTVHMKQCSRSVCTERQHSPRFVFPVHHRMCCNSRSVLSSDDELGAAHRQARRHTAYVGVSAYSLFFGIAKDFGL